MHAEWGSLLPREVLRFLHVAGVLLLMLADGASIAAMFRVKREKEAARIAALLDLSRATTPVLWGSLTLIALTGALSATLQHAWDEFWVLASSALFVAVAFAGFFWGTVPLNAVRRAAGLPYRVRGLLRPARAPDLASLSLARRALAPWRIALVGLAAILAIVWLMMARPGAPAL